MKYDHSNFNAQRAYSGAANDRIANFLPMVRKLAWYYEGSCGASLDIDDLLQAGMIALTECAQRHDRPGEDGFAAYAKMRVRGAMIDLLRTQSPHARGAAGQRRRIEAATDRLHPAGAGTVGSGNSGRNADIGGGISRHAHATGNPGGRPRRCYSDSNPMFESSEPDAEAQLLEQDDRTALAEAIGLLPERLQLVIKLPIEELNRPRLLQCST